MAWPTVTIELAGDLFRLGEPHGDAGHRLGDEAQLLRAPHHVGQHDRRTRSAPARSRQGRSWPACRPCPGSARPAGRADRGTARATPPSDPGEREQRSRPDRRSWPDAAASVCRICPIDWRSSLAARPRRRADRHRVTVRRLRTDPCRPTGPMRARTRRVASALRARLGSVRRSPVRPLAGWSEVLRDLLDRRQGRIRRVLHLFRVVRHVGRRLTFVTLVLGTAAAE